MLIVIVGGGKVGFSIADMLSKEQHDVVIIDDNKEKIAILEDRLDVKVIHGNAASTAVLESAGISRAKLLLAVTESDEVNMMICLLGKQAGVEFTVARVGNPEYLEEKSSGASFLSGIDLIINPEIIAAETIIKLIGAPEALDVMYYADNRIIVLELPITEKIPVNGIRIDQLSSKLPYVILAIIRDGKVTIPSGSDQLWKGDIIYLLAKTDEMPRIENIFGMERKKVQRVMIMGGGRTGGHLAKLLRKKDYSLKIIEKDFNRCQKLAEEHHNVLVINGDATDLDLLKQEGAGKVDVFISVTDDDRVNLLVCVIAKQLGAKRTISMVRRQDYADIYKNCGIDIGLCSKTMAANAIYKYIKNSQNLLSFTMLRKEDISRLDFELTPQSKIAGRKLKGIALPKGAIIASVIRGGKIIITRGNIQFLPADKVTVFCLPGISDQVIKLFR